MNVEDLKVLLSLSFHSNKSLPLYGYICEKENIKRNFSKIHKQNLKEYKWKKYSDVYNDIKNFTNNFIKTFCDNYIGLIAENSYESIILLLSSMLTNNFGVFTIYPNIFDDSYLLKILADSPARVYSIDKEQFEKIHSLSLTHLNEITQYVSVFILFDNDKFNTEYIKSQEKYIELCKKINFINFSQFFQENVEELIVKEKSSFNLISLTSENFKLCHFNDKSIISTIHDLNNFNCFKFNEFDTYYMINSLSDITEIIFLVKLIFSGGKFGICTNFSEFFSEIELLHPTLLNTYPIIWKKVYTSLKMILSTLSEDKKGVVENAISIKMSNSKLENEQHCIWDKLVFDKIKARFGSKVKYIYSTSDILSYSITKFLEISLQCQFVCIYGHTETCGFVGVNLETDGSIGEVLSSRTLDIKPLKSITFYGELPPLVTKRGTYVDNLVGELVVVSDSIFTGYFSKDTPTTDIKNKIMFQTEDCFTKEESSYFFIDKVDEILTLENNCILSPLKFESLYNEVFRETINNIFLSQNDNKELIVVAHLVKSLKKIHETSEEEKEKLKEEILKTIREKHLIQMKKELLPKTVYFLENNKKLFSPKMKIKRKALKKEISISSGK